MLKQSKAYNTEKQIWKRNVSFYKREKFSPFFQYLLKEKLSCYGITTFKDKIVVDIGGATGYFLSYLKKKINFYGITIDFIFEMLEEGKKNSYTKGNTFLNSTANALALKNNCIDVVILNGVLHHFKSAFILNECIEEIDRILKKDGYICIYDRNGSFVSRFFHTLAIIFKRILQKIKGDFSSSSSNIEVDFNDNDLKLFLKKKYFIRKRTFISSFPFFFLLVFCNFCEYIFGFIFAQRLRKILIPIGIFFEKIFAFKILTIEQCLVLCKEEI